MMPAMGTGHDYGAESTTLSSAPWQIGILPAPEGLFRARSTHPDFQGTGWDPSIGQLRNAKNDEN